MAVMEKVRRRQQRLGNRQLGAHKAPGAVPQSPVRAPPPPPRLRSQRRTAAAGPGRRSAALERRRCRGNQHRRATSSSLVSQSFTERTARSPCPLRPNAHLSTGSCALVSWSPLTARSQVSPAHLRAPLASAHEPVCAAHTARHILLGGSDEKTAPLGSRWRRQVIRAQVSILTAAGAGGSSRPPPLARLAETDASRSSVQSSAALSLSCSLVQPSVVCCQAANRPPTPPPPPPSSSPLLRSRSASKCTLQSTLGSSRAGREKNQ